MSDRKGCVHLDFREDHYAPGCRIVTIGGLKCWERLAVPYEGAPVFVQFCGLGRGRINNPHQCYSAPGPSGCYVAPGAEGPAGGGT